MPADQYPPDDPRRRGAQDEAAQSPWGAPADAPPPAPPSGWNAPNQAPPPSWGGPAQAPPASWGAAPQAPRPSWGEPGQAPPSWDAAAQAPGASWGAAAQGPPAPWGAPGPPPAQPSGPPPAAWSTQSSAAGAWATHSQRESGAGNLGLAIMGGFAGAVVAGLIWWGIVATTRMQIFYLAFGVGWIVAQGVLICAQQRNRIPLQVVAGTFTLLALGVSEYFIQRSLFIADGGSLPLWNGFDFGLDVVREGLKDDPLTGFFWIAGVIVAIVVAGKQDAITQGR